MGENEKVIPEDWNDDADGSEATEPAADENALEHGPRMPAGAEELENGQPIPADWNKPDAEEVE